MQTKANKLDLTGIFGLVAPLAATLTLFKATGSIGRIQRDDPYWLWVAITLVLVAGTLLTLSSFLSGDGESTRSKRWARGLFFGAAVLAAIGFAISLQLIFVDAGEEPRPSITATLNPAESKLTAHVTASHLKTDHRLALKVDLATLEHGKTIDDLHPFAKGHSLALERAYVGPDTDGNVDQVVSVSIPSGGGYTDVVIKAFTAEKNRSCTEPAGASPDTGTACTFLALSRSSSRP
jgi:hypothetical protein